MLNKIYAVLRKKKEMRITVIQGDKTDRELVPCACVNAEKYMNSPLKRSNDNVGFTYDRYLPIVL